MKDIELWKGDCLELLPKIETKSVDLVFADLPYGTTACSWDVIIPFKELWSELLRIGKPRCNYVFTASQPFTSLLVSSNIEMFKYEWIWEKEQATNPMLAKKQIMKVHENILVFYNQQGYYNPQMTEGKPYSGFLDETKKIGEVYGGRKSVHKKNNGTRYPKSIQKFSREDRRKKLHPTRKSNSLMDYVLNTYSIEGDLVVDPTMGSGTTGESAKRLSRRFVGIEKDDKYFYTAYKNIYE